MDNGNRKIADPGRTDDNDFCTIPTEA